MWELWFVILIYFLIQYLWKTHFLFFPLLLSTLTTLYISTYAHSFLVQALCFILLFSFSTLLCTTFHFNPSPFTLHASHQLDTLIGSTGIVTHTIGASSLESGIVKLDHEKWCALSYDHKKIAPGQTITVKKVEGVYLIVSPVSSTVNI